MLPLNVAMQGIQNQMMLQQQMQAYENASASGGTGGGLLGGALSLGAQGLGAYMGAGGNPLAAAGSLFSNMSQSSGGGGVNLSGYTPSLWGNVGSYGGMPYSWGNIGGGYAY